MSQVEWPVSGEGERVNEKIGISIYPLIIYLCNLNIHTAIASDQDTNWNNSWRRHMKGPDSFLSVGACSNLTHAHHIVFLHGIIEIRNLKVNIADGKRFKIVPGQFIVFY